MISCSLPFCDKVVWSNSGPVPSLGVCPDPKVQCKLLLACLNAHIPLSKLQIPIKIYKLLIEIK